MDTSLLLFSLIYSIGLLLAGILGGFAGMFVGLLTGFQKLSQPLALVLATFGPIFLIYALTSFTNAQYGWGNFVMPMTISGIFVPFVWKSGVGRMLIPIIIWQLVFGTFATYQFLGIMDNNDYGFGYYRLYQEKYGIDYSAKLGELYAVSILTTGFYLLFTSLLLVLPYSLAGWLRGRDSLFPQNNPQNISD